MFTFRKISDWMNSGQEFSCRVISYDRKRKAGGQVLYYEGVLVRAQDLGHDRSLTRKEKLQALLDADMPRDPNHRKWHTRNIRLLTNGHPTGIIKKIHLPLIIEFNDQPVVP